MVTQLHPLALFNGSKSIVTQLQRHLIIQKNRREAIIRQERTDISQLLQIGQIEQARARVALHISPAVVLSKLLVAVCG